MIERQTVRELALALPDAEEHEHFGRPSFRLRGKIFATLWPGENRAMVKLDREAQMKLIRENRARRSRDSRAAGDLTPLKPNFSL